MNNNSLDKYSIEIPSNIKNKEDINIYKYDDFDKQNSKTSIPGIRTFLIDDKLKNKILNCFLSKIGCIEYTRNGKIMYKKIQIHTRTTAILINISRHFSVSTMIIYSS